MAFDLCPRETAEDWERIATRMSRVQDSLAGFTVSLRHGLATGSIAARRQALVCAEQAATLGGLKRRTRCMMGRCQGFYCARRVLQLAGDRIDAMFGFDVVRRPRGALFVSLAAQLTLDPSPPSSAAATMSGVGLGYNDIVVTTATAGLGWRWW